MTNLSFPSLTRVKLSRFSLYNQQPEIDVEINEGVFCLAGANGLGKSTFLMSINFGLTGLVRDPERQFASVEEFYKETAAYGREFFTGRITESDRSLAEVGIDFGIKGTIYKITRGVFDKEGLRECLVSDGEKTIIYDGRNESAVERQSNFEQLLIKQIGLDTFQQFAFLQLAVFTFDESRHLLLWDQNALNQALYLCIGTDYKKAAKAERFRRDSERAASLARNYSWRASQLRSDLRVLLKALENPLFSPEEIENFETIHKDATEQVDVSQKVVDVKKAEANDSLLRWAELSSQMATINANYELEFSKFLKESADIHLHPIIRGTLEEGNCLICGSENENVPLNIRHNLEEENCPLCGSKLIPARPPDKALARLQDLDKQLDKTRNDLEEAFKRKSRISIELSEAEKNFKSSLGSLQELEKANEDLLKYLRIHSGDLGNAIAVKREAMEELEHKRDEKYKERDDKREAHLKLQKELNNEYEKAKADFVPIFKNLAISFIGIDLDIRGEFSTTQTTQGLSLSLEVQGTIRRNHQQLSESQRFFLDIALRMALATYASTSHDRATFFVDTPEGSLDIAYESRVGHMFAQFTEPGHNLLMTANINSSQILKRLARECGRERMTLHDMTVWTELTDVQKEEDLFRDVIAEIENEFDEA